MRCIDHGKRNIALASRRPYRGRDAADFAFAAVVGVEQRIVRRFVAGDIQAHQLTPRPALPFCNERATAGEMALVEIDQPGKTQLQRRAIAAGANGMFRGYEIGADRASF